MKSVKSELNVAEDVLGQAAHDLTQTLAGMDEGRVDAFKRQFMMIPLEKMIETWMTAVAERRGDLRDHLVPEGLGEDMLAPFVAAAWRRMDWKQLPQFIT